MKKCILLSLIIVIISTYPVLASGKSTCDGALGLRWGDNFLQMAKTMLIENEYNYKSMLDMGRKKNYLYTGDVSKNKADIMTELFDDKLYYIRVKFDLSNKNAVSEYNELKEYCINKYGKPDLEEAFKCLWLVSSSSNEDVRIYLRSDKNILNISYTNEPLVLEAEKYEDEMSKEYLNDKYKNL